MSAIEVDTTRLPLLLHDLRLPAIARLWPEFAERADKEGWPAARFLAALAASGYSVVVFTTRHPAGVWLPPRRAELLALGILDRAQ